jgi:hypothetical protein
MKAAHIVLGVLAIALTGAAGGVGAWRWWRFQASVLFWRLLRASQVVIVVEAALGGILVLMGRKAPGLHVLYGLLPLAISFVAEQLRIASAEEVLAGRGHQTAADVGRLPAEEQRWVVLAIVRREIGVMTLAALVNLVLLVRAAGS